jgi:hypothetical protein
VGHVPGEQVALDHGEIVGSDIFLEHEPVDEMLHRPQAIQ